jgi:hypothetical protein
VQFVDMRMALLERDDYRSLMCGDGRKFAFAPRFHYLYGKIRNSMTDFRIGHGYDVHALADGLPLVLGGIEIPHTKGFVAHSDGDVAIHAVCDALLGAAALGDIGIHFPDTSDDFRGIDSKILLRRVAALLREKGGTDAAGCRTCSCRFGIAVEFADACYQAYLDR